MSYSQPKRMSLDLSGDETSSFLTATASSSRYADSFRSYDGPAKSTSPAYNRLSVDDFESSTASARFYDEYSYLDHSDFESSSDTHRLIMLHRGHREALFPSAQLKLPPARQSFDKSSGKRSLTPSRRRPALHVHRRSLWNDDFDPFMAALKNVRREGVGDDNQAGKNRAHRRVRSDSPVHDDGPGPEVKPKPKLMWIRSMPRVRSPSPIPSPRVRSSSPIPSPTPIKSPQPKGVMYARHTRLVKMDSEQAAAQDDLGDRIKVSCNCHAGGSKREMIKNLVVSIKGKGEEEEDEAKKEGDQRPKMSRRKRLMRKLSFKSGRRSLDDEEKRVSASAAEAIGMGKRLVQSRSNMLLCMGLKNKIYAS